ALPAGKGGVGPLGFLNGFEGQVDVLARGKLSSSSKANAPVTVSLLLKEGKIRADVPPGLTSDEKMGHVYGIYDGPGKKRAIVMDAQKQAIVIDLNKAGEHLKSVGGGPHTPQTPGGGGGPSKPPPKVTKTGKSDTVAGYTCEIWEITDEGSRAQVCIAS